jgi:SAM-dependent methyltransferase
VSSAIRCEWEKAEIERSAFEARGDKGSLVVDEKVIDRYASPPSDTAFPLEYSYYCLGDVMGKTVLEYGCGDGLNTVILARRGANVKALDISPDLIALARKRFEVNRITAEVDFIVGSAHDLPLPDESIDVVFGMAILHHLDLSQSASEVLRVLRPGGRAIFQEPVRNSRLIRYMRNAIPYRSPDVSPFERPLTDKELNEYGRGFSTFRSTAFLLPTTSLVSALPKLNKFELRMTKFDKTLLTRFPSMTYFSAVRVIELVK